MDEESDQLTWILLQRQVSWTCQAHSVSEVEAFLGDVSWFIYRILRLCLKSREVSQKRKCFLLWLSGEMGSNVEIWVGLT